MIFKCRNCGGNVVYSPERHKMYCPYCDSIESDEKVTNGQSLVACNNCGGELQIAEYTSASRCPYCDTYIIHDERVTGKYAPNLILPFKFSKEQVKGLLRDKFKSYIFAPDDFLSEAMLESMKGMYVPFWMYDYHVRGYYDGEGTRIRTWRSGNTEYTETSVYRIVRDMEVDFDKMPVDASYAMPDDIMDLMEPYNYKELEGFKAEYMSGFSAECYNTDDLASEPRAVAKAKQDAEAILRQSINFTSLRSTSNNQVTLTRTDTNYSLLPVWIYNYVYKGENFKFHVNGQTGKVVGKVPTSKGKMWGYTATVFGGVFTILMFVRALLMLL